MSGSSSFFFPSSMDISRAASRLINTYMLLLALVQVEMRASSPFGLVSAATISSAMMMSLSFVDVCFPLIPRIGAPSPGDRLAVG